MKACLVVVNLLVTILFVQCTSPTSKSLENNIKTDTDITNWAKDKNGCLGLRSNNLASKLIKEYHLASNSREEFLKIFNSADKIDAVNGTEILIYYWGNICRAGNIDKADKCYADFYFKDRKLVDTSFPCE